ncbi:tll1903 [Thermosynechococcus vestitus BP-1]|uniref:Tll1903 protein n=2 Tax=Thermosynechococcus vestitus TaxID=146786 RepID=Q8DHP2_THEVB|nr:tll1903 [Thermosynechococcus vestitus BP-1]
MKIRTSMTVATVPLPELERLQQQASQWQRLSPRQRIPYLQAVKVLARRHATEWVTLACEIKGIDPQGLWAGEEWTTGPLGLILKLDHYLYALRHEATPPVRRWRTAPTGQAIAEIVPRNWQERLLWFGVKAEVWLQPNHPPTQGSAYRNPPPPGVAVVLGAGNITSLCLADALYQLVVANRVALLKMNPLLAPLTDCFRKVCAPLIEAGFLEIVEGDAALGEVLCHHPLTQHIHITGSHHTYNRLVWGETAAEQALRKARQQPKLTKPVTAELGNVTPLLMVPGEWTESELAYQARQVASALVHNASFNCIGAQILVTAAGWPQREAFLNALKAQLQGIPSRPAYYPGAIARYESFLADYPQATVLSPSGEGTIPWTLIEGLTPTANPRIFQEEVFCGLLAEVQLPVNDVPAYLATAVTFVNERLWGTLGCSLIIDPRTEASHAEALERAIAQLRYGAIAINAWVSLAYGLGCTPWGAFPGHRPAAIGSGVGVVHNSFLFDYPEKAVVRVPFQLPVTPPWFYGHRTLPQLAQAVIDIYAGGNPLAWLSLLTAALRG